MSPLGTLVLPSRRNSFTPNPVSSSSIINDHPLSKLMSVSFGTESSRPLNLHHSLALTLASNCPNKNSHSNQSNLSRMTLKQSRSQSKPDSTASPGLYSNIIYSERRSPLPKRHEEDELATEDDEVLSIGRDDEQSMIIDCDSSPESPQSGSERVSPKNCENDPDPDPSSDGTSMRSGSSPSLQSPTLSMDSCRVRNYSSEDSSIKSFPLSLTEAFLNNHLSSGNTRSLGLSHQLLNPSQAQSLHHHHQASLFFSIANILRPDFGLGNSAKSPPSAPSSFLHRHHQTANGKPSKRASKTVQLPELPKKLSRRAEPVIPIDLSRPGSNGSPSSIPSSLHKTSASPINGSTKSSNNSKPSTGHPRGNSGKEASSESKGDDKSNGTLWPAWVYCTRYSDRPSSGPRTRRGRKQKEKEIDEKRPRTAFTAEQLSRLKKEFEENRYLTEKRRQDLAKDLRLHENQIKIWFQNKRAKLKKASGTRGGLALQLMAQGLYNHSTIPPRGCGDEDDDDEDSD